jgi:hypothetical protein
MDINFEEIILRQQLSSRGGGIEVDLTSLGFPEAKMTVYQNYLGGGMLGRVCNDCTISDWRDDAKLSKIAAELRQFMHKVTNPSDDAWESVSYEQNQKMPVSAY